MREGNILGVELNAEYCQISYYDYEKHEPETVEARVDQFFIPLMIGCINDDWVYGIHAKRLATVAPSSVASDLYTKALKRERVVFGDQKKDAIRVLAKFLQMALERFTDIEYLAFSVPETDIDISKMLKGMGRFLGLPKERILVLDYKESFCQYMFFQPKELWQFETALFCCEHNEMRAYMLRRLNTVSGRNKDAFVTVDEVANAKMEELSAIYPVLNVDKAKDVDEKFKKFIQGVMDKKVVSSVYLTGEGFENNWYPNSLKVLCNGRRAFIGNNLYSKGACYAAFRQTKDDSNMPVYLDSTKVMEQVYLRIRVHGKECWYPIVKWGSHWYEADTQLEVLLEDTSDIEIHIESLLTGEIKAETVSLEGMPARKGYSMRLSIEVMFLDERQCVIMFRDVGFGNFFPPSGFQTEKIIELGGSNEQFNSMS